MKNTDLTKASLETLGIGLADDSNKNIPMFYAIMDELRRRVEGDSNKAKVLLEYHQGQFLKNPSSKAWNEVVGMMFLWQSFSVPSRNSTLTPAPTASV
jgi:hypothetical protein